MITGDNPLTACHVARELHFIQREHTLILGPAQTPGEDARLKRLSLCDDLGRALGGELKPDWSPSPVNHRFEPYHCQPIRLPPYENWPLPSSNVPPVVMSCVCVSGEWHWESIDGSVCVPLHPPLVPSLITQYDLCVTGEGLDQLTADPRLLRALLPHVRVFARVSPKQKVRGPALSL